jgi:hypothetical protein
MTDFHVTKDGDSIAVRGVLSIDEAISIRDTLREEYRRIPNLNQETFADFAEWVFEDIEDCALKALLSFKCAPYTDETEPPDEDEPSSFEPW